MVVWRCERSVILTLAFLIVPAPVCPPSFNAEEKKKILRERGTKIQTRLWKHFPRGIIAATDPPFSFGIPSRIRGDRFLSLPKSVVRGGWLGRVLSRRVLMKRPLWPGGGEAFLRFGRSLEDRFDIAADRDKKIFLERGIPNAKESMVTCKRRSEREGKRHVVAVNGSAGWLGRISLVSRPL